MFARIRRNNRIDTAFYSFRVLERRSVGDPASLSKKVFFGGRLKDQMVPHLEVVDRSDGSPKRSGSKVKNNLDMRFSSTDTTNRSFSKFR